MEPTTLKKKLKNVIYLLTYVVVSSFSCLYKNVSCDELIVNIQEAAWAVEPKMKPGWPNHGNIQFEDYQVRYREGLDLVLKDVSFVVRGGEKVMYYEEGRI